MSLENDRVSIPLKNHKGHATFIGEPSKELIDAVNSLADLAYKKLKVAPPTANPMPFDIWMKKLHRLLCLYDYIKPETKLSEEDWKVFYEEGLKPTESINADMEVKINFLPKWFHRSGKLPKQIKSRCCGRCDGINDLCVTDMVCDLHNIEGCEKCYGSRNKCTLKCDSCGQEWEEIMPEGVFKMDCPVCSVTPTPPPNDIV